MSRTHDRSNLTVSKILTCLFVGPVVLCAIAATTAAIAQQVTSSRPVTTARQSNAEQQIAEPDRSVLSLAAARISGREQSSLRKHEPVAAGSQLPEPRLDEFLKSIAPVLRSACSDCHGADTQEASLRVDRLNPDLQNGEDVKWWLEVVDVLSNDEMPPKDGGELSDRDRNHLIEWLSSEIQTASAVRRSQEGHSSFRRMARYEYNYALQDLLGLPYEFARDLPPEAHSEDGFLNSSDVLQMSLTRFAYYRDLGRQALQKATVMGDRPSPIYWSISMDAAASRMQAKYESDLEKKKRQFKNDPEKLERELKKFAAKSKSRPGGAHYANLETGVNFRASWSYRGARNAWPSTDEKPPVPPVSSMVAVIPPQQKLTVELGNRVPDSGILRVRIRASRIAPDNESIPSLRLEYGFQASNNSSASTRISGPDIPILASPDGPEFYQFEIPLSELTIRNPMRRETSMGETPSPSEYLKLHNNSFSRGDIRIDYIEVTAPVYNQWSREQCWCQRLSGTSRWLQPDPPVVS